MKNYLVIILSYLSLTLMAQDAEPLWCHELNMLDGLSSDQYNFFISCDSEDYIWVSSTKGLNRFDGKTIRQYHGDFSDSTQLYGQNIQSKMYEDERGDLWFCTYEAIHCYRRQSDDFVHYFVMDSLGKRVESDYRVFHLEQGKYLWFRAGTNSKDNTFNIYRVDLSGNNLSTSQAGKAFSKCRPLLRTKHYHLYAAEDSRGEVQSLSAVSEGKLPGMDYFSKRGDQFILRVLYDNSDQEHGPKKIFQVHYDAMDTLWLSTEDGLKRWNPLTAQWLHFPFPFQTKKIVYLEEADDAHFLVSAYEKGLFLFDKKTGSYKPFSLFPIKNRTTPLDKFTRNIYLDHNKVLWITVAERGVVFTHLHKRKFEFHNNKFTNNKNIHLKELIPLHDHTCLAVHQTGWYQVDEQGKVLTSSVVKVASAVNTACLLDGELLLGTNDALHVASLKTRKFEKIKANQNMDFLDIIPIGHQTALASILAQGIHKVFKTSQGWQIEKVNGNVSNTMYVHLFQNCNGDIFACDNELNVDVLAWDGKELRLKKELDIKGTVYHYYEDTARGILWVATSFGLVKVVANEELSVQHVYDQKHGIADNSVFTITPAVDNKLWLSTFRGLSLFNPEQESAHTFSLADGTLSEQFLPDVALARPNGELWFGGNNGITVLADHGFKYGNKKPGILITDFRIDGEVPEHVICVKTKNTNINKVQHLEYDHKKNSFSFEFVATDYADPTNARIRYKLNKIGEGADKWQEVKVGERAIARYRNLPHGHYQLEVEAFNSDKVPNLIARKAITITILPRFWERKEFWPLVFAAFMLLSLLFYNWLLKTKLEKEALKTKIAINEMQALLGQMKPHFIFNSLNAINKNVLSGEKQRASEYLGRFAGLIRMMLENSRSTTHSLETEVKFLELYLKVEAQRFNPSFTYHIEVDEEIDPGVTKIPTMMLQPFVENAIWHGVSNRGEGGKILIRIKQEGELLNCTIEDNGVGREAAGLIAEQRGKKTHTSRASNIVEERLSLLFPKQKNLCKLSYEDVLDESGLVSGTRVVIVLPMVER